MYTIGEFSRITGLTVKTLRFYHEQGLLAPSCVDDESGYRYYDAGKIEAARVISALRALDVPLEEIAGILGGGEEDEADILEVLERHRQTVDGRRRRDSQIVREIDGIISKEREARMAMTAASAFKVEEKEVPAMLIAGVRMKGRYSECGKGFALIGRRLGRHICGKPMMLHYDTEYREPDADFEACMPVRRRVEAEGILVRELPGGRCVSLFHKGLTRSWGGRTRGFCSTSRTAGTRWNVPAARCTGRARA